MVQPGSAEVVAWVQAVDAEYNKVAGQGGGKSGNGWPIDPPRSKRTIPGTNVSVVVADGPAGDVLMYVLGQVQARKVDNISEETGGPGVIDDHGYANRNVRGSSTTKSNHASATAVDINAPKHPQLPQGSPRTFTPEQTDEIHRILGEVDEVVRWGGDYTTSKLDEMHFEINADQEAVTRVADRLRAEGKI